MSTEQRSLLARLAILTITVLLAAPGNTQAPERTPYSAPAGWTVTTYRAANSRAFLRCSAERHYDDGSALTIAKNNAANIVLGFTSTEWPFEDGSTQTVLLRIDSGEERRLPGRVRILPSGPIVFVDLVSTSAMVPAIRKGTTLQVSSGGTTLTFGLTGSAAAIASVDRCHRDGSQL